MHPLELGGAQAQLLDLLDAEQREAGGVGAALALDIALASCDLGVASEPSRSATRSCRRNTGR